MLNCDLCDYYENIQAYKGMENKNVSICQFTGFIFNKDLEEFDIEYPCKNVAYEKYSASMHKVKFSYKIIDIDWKFIYMKRHIKPMLNKRRISA